MSFHGLVDAQYFLMLQIGEDWISHYRINWSESDFMENQDNHEILFWYCKIHKINENINIPNLCQFDCHQ
jgi:hypothetical protein